MNNKPTRVRFAPSPTGPLHMGGVRTALYNYLYAKQRGGTFILRIEDTDSQRFVPGAEKYIIDSLRWCGIIPDEGVNEDGTIVTEPSPKHPFGPYRQSQRKGIYRKYAEELIEKGYAYYAFDSSEELDKIRKEFEARGETFIYNQATRTSLRNSLTLPPQECEKLIQEDNHWTIRFKVPENTTINMHDLIRGDISVESSTLDDKVLWKAADQLPTYHLANIIDDHLMEITQVIRGEEWLPSLPLHYLLYKAFGWQDCQPEFAHLSLLLKPDGKGKLSKRDGDRLGFPVFPLLWNSPTGEVSRGYREDGYYPEAFVNIIALLGWNFGTEQELFTMDELIRDFSLERVIKAGAKFNPEKAKWFNQQYLRQRTDAQLANEFMPILKEKGIDTTMEYVEKVCSMIKERVHFVSEFWDVADYLFVAPTTYDPQSVAKFWKEENMEMIKKSASIIAAIEPFDQTSIDEILHAYIIENQWPMGKIMNAFRVALVGRSQGLGIGEILSLLGKEESLRRIEKINLP